MVHSSKTKRSIIVLAILALATLLLGGYFAVRQSISASAANSTQSVTLSSQAYEFEDNSGYGFETSNKVKSYSNGSTALGTLSVEGEKLTQSTYGGVQAIGLDSGTSLTFSYKQTVSTKYYDGYDRKLSDDSATSICGYNTGTIGSGAIIVLKGKSSSGPWSLATKMVGINGSTFSFTPSGDDVKAGMYYRFLSVAEIYYTTSRTYRTWYTLWIGTKTEYTNHCSNLGQESIVYVCSNSAAISFTTQETKNHDIVNDDLTDEQISLAKKGATLSDGAASFSPITVDSLGNSCYQISYSFNGGAYSSISGKKTLTAPGRYTVKVKTPLGKEKFTTLYIMDKGDDLGASSYFGEGIIDGSMRIFDPTKGVPTYMIGKKYRIEPIANVPGLWGSLYYYKDDMALKTNDYTETRTFAGQTQGTEGIFTEEGYYIFDLYSNNPAITSGEIVNYSYRLYIKDQPDYVPAVNRGLITATSRNILFERKIYATVLRTAGGGSFVYAFPHTDAYYEEALTLAEQIELLSVEDYGSYYYYKSLDPAVNTKQKYTSKSKLFEAIGVFAERNVCTLYLENNSEYLTRAADEESLKNLTQQSIQNDVLVVVNEKVKRDLQADEAYLNGFAFAQVASYESAMITLSDEDNKEMIVPYNVCLDECLIATQKYTVTESCWNGSVTYNAIYYNKNDNKAEIVLSVSNKTCTITFESDVATIIGSRVKILSAVDQYDSQSIIVITAANGESRTMLLSEVGNYLFPNRDMDYTISIIPRLGSEKTFNLSVKYDEAPGSEWDNEAANGFDFFEGKSMRGHGESGGVNQTTHSEGSNQCFLVRTDLSGGAIAGIVVGCVAALGIIIVTAAFLTKRRKTYN